MLGWLRVHHRYAAVQKLLKLISIGVIYTYIYIYYVPELAESLPSLAQGQKVCLAVLSWTYPDVEKR